MRLQIKSHETMFRPFEITFTIQTWQEFNQFKNAVITRMDERISKALQKQFDNIEQGIAVDYMN